MRGVILPKRLKQSKAYHESPKQEAALAEEIGGKRIPGSGSRALKGDVRLAGIVRIEAKTTEAKSFTVTRKMLDKISAAAETAGEMPVLVVDFMPAGGHRGGRFVVCPAYVIKHITDSDI